MITQQINTATKRLHSSTKPTKTYFPITDCYRPSPKYGHRNEAKYTSLIWFHPTQIHWRSLVIPFPSGKNTCKRIQLSKNTPFSAERSQIRQWGQIWTTNAKHSQKQLTFQTASSNGFNQETVRKLIFSRWKLGRFQKFSSLFSLLNLFIYPSISCVFVSWFRSNNLAEIVCKLTNLNLKEKNL